MSHSTETSNMEAADFSRAVEAPSTIPSPVRVHQQEKDFGANNMRGILYASGAVIGFYSLLAGFVVFGFHVVVTLTN